MPSELAKACHPCLQHRRAQEGAWLPHGEVFYPNHTPGGTYQDRGPNLGHLAALVVGVWPGAGGYLPRSCLPRPAPCLLMRRRQRCAPRPPCSTCLSAAYGAACSPRSVMGGASGGAGVSGQPVFCGRHLLTETANG